MEVQISQEVPATVSEAPPLFGSSGNARDRQERGRKEKKVVGEGKEKRRTWRREGGAEQGWPARLGQSGGRKDSPGEGKRRDRLDKKMGQQGARKKQKGTERKTDWQRLKRERKKTEGRMRGKGTLKGEEDRMQRGGEVQTGGDRERDRKGAKGRLCPSVRPCWQPSHRPGRQLGAVWVWRSCVAGQPCGFPLGLLLSCNANLRGPSSGSLGHLWNHQAVLSSAQCRRHCCSRLTALSHTRHSLSFPFPG